MNCHECRYLMFDYVDDKMSEPLKTEMDQHLEQCTACTERLAGLKARQQEEKLAGMFWYLLRPSGGFKRFFIIGAILTFILVLALVSIQMKKPLFRFF